MTAKVDYSIVIPAFNEERLLPRTLKALQLAMQTATGWSGEIIVVDNASHDATAAVAREWQAKVVYEPVRQISRARNRGASAAVGKVLIFVDADTMIPPQLLKLVLGELDQVEICGGGALIGTTDEITFVVQCTISVWNRLSRWRRWAAGSFLFCLAEAWRETGGFSEDVFAAEEILFSRKLKEWGKRRNLEVRILPCFVDTSMRKVRWYTLKQLLWLTVRLLFFPWLLRSRRSCRLWYDRPVSDGKSEDKDQYTGN